MKNKIFVCLLTAAMLFCLCACKEEREVPADTTSETTAAETEAPVIEKTPEPLGFEGGNISAGGFMCADGDGFVYYRSESDNWYLYRARLDGSEKTKLAEDCPERINVLFGWVYYLSCLENFSLCRVRCDGTDREMLVDGYCSNLYAAESGLYFDLRDENNSEQAYRAELDGSGMTLLVPDARVAYYYDNILYVFSPQRLCAYNIETGAITALADKNTNSISVNDKGIFYWSVDENTYCRMDFDGANNEILHKGGYYFNLTGDNLYYLEFGDKENEYVQLFRLDISNGGSEIILSLSAEYFDMDGTPFGVTVSGLRDGNARIDESMLDDEGVFRGVLENADYVYSARGIPFVRASTQKSRLVSGKWSCWLRLDENTLWD